MEMHVASHAVHCPIVHKDAILPLLADPAHPGYAVRFLEYTKAASARGLPSSGAIAAVHGYAHFCALLGLQMQTSDVPDYAAALEEVRRVSVDLDYPDGIACSRNDYDKHATSMVVRGDALLRHYDGHWSAVAAAAGLRAESRNYYMSVAYHRRMQRDADALLASLGEVAEQRKRIAAAEDEFPLRAAHSYEVPGSRRIEQRNDGTVAVRYEVATVLR